VVGIIGAMVGALLTFVIAVAAAAVPHLNVPATRRLVATRVNALLVEQFAGVVAIERIEGLGLRGVDGVRLRVKDPDGVQVLYVDGARVRVRSFEAARSLIFGKSDIAVTVDGATVAQVDASVDSDAAGKLRLARAFASHTPTRPRTAPSIRWPAPSPARRSRCSTLTESSRTASGAPSEASWTLVVTPTSS